METTGYGKEFKNQEFKFLTQLILESLDIERPPPYLTLLPDIKIKINKTKKKKLKKYFFFLVSTLTYLTSV